ncbi:MAG: acyl-CoA synthetase [Gammaproteobacteria bacterium 39-13]|nr:MAG: acyl-CoA synthetase [Gammaproteobacteria bacterium 39-13]
MVLPIASAAPLSEISHEVKTINLKETTYESATAQSLVEILLKQASIEPDRVHIYFQNEKGEEKIITYGELYTEAKRVANGLHEYGIGEGETIAIMLPTCEDFFYTFFGVLLLAAIPVPIYPPFRPDRIEEYAMREANILKNAEVRLLITFHKAERLSELLQVFISSLKAVTTVEVLKNSTAKAPNRTITGDMPALIQYTSGSTSAPKGVLLTHNNLLANIRAAGAAMQVGPTDVGASWLPLYHDMGLIGAWFICFYHAIPVVIMSPLSFLSHPERWLWAIHYHRATLSAAPNFAYELCMRRITPTMIEGLDLSSWRLTLNGAEAVNPKTITQFIKKFSPYGFKPETMFPVYGLAESSVALTFPPLNRPPVIDTIKREPFEREQKAIAADAGDSKTLQFVCCGKAIPGHEIRVVDENNQEVPERKIGFLHFRGPSTMRGYYQQPEATQKITHDGWTDTGDMAYLAEGEIYITGRKKDTIIKAGRNLYPEEIEEVTAQVSGVRKGCVVAFGVQDQKSGTEQLIIVAEAKEISASEQKKIVAEVNEKIAVVLGIVPDEVLIVPGKTLTKTSSGKLQRAATKQAYIDKKLLRHALPFWAQIAKLSAKGLKLKLTNLFRSAWKGIYTFYVGILTVLCAIIVWGSVLVFKPSRAAQITKAITKIGTILMGCRIQVENENALSNAGATVYVANHASYMDAIVLIAVLPPGVRFVAKKELLKVPFLRTIITRLNIITVDRVDFLTNLSDTQKIVDELQEGKSIVFFPEGTFTYATGVRPFKLGAFKAAVESGTPVCAVAIQGTRSILRDDEWLFQPGKIKVTIGEILAPQSKEWQEVIRLHSLARAQIAKHCGEQVLDY